MLMLTNSCACVYLSGDADSCEKFGPIESELLLQECEQTITSSMVGPPGSTRMREFSPVRLGLA